MRRIAIIGGGLSGLTAAYEFATRARTGALIEFRLFEQTARLGGTIETVRRDGFTIEGGPDGWVSEKPWARGLAIELGLAGELIASNDAERKTYIFSGQRLRAMPDGMRMMVPTNLEALSRSDLFNRAAIRAFEQEITRADVLRATAPAEDESIASFTRRHFGNEVLETVAAPLLSGVFGGDVRRLSVQAIMAPFVAVEREHGSLIRGFQVREAERSGRTQQSLFTTLRDGLGTLIDALVSRIPAAAISRRTRVLDVQHDRGRWRVRSVAEPYRNEAEESKATRSSGDPLASTINQDSSVDKPMYEEFFDVVILATPLDMTRHLLRPLDRSASQLLPARASSAIIVALAWKDARLSMDPASSATFDPPPGFGLLVPPFHDLRALFAPRLLAATFVDQKFSYRVPAGGRLLRAFFGGVAARSLARASDAQVIAVALRELHDLLGPLPIGAPLAIVRRWPGSLPQYETGHLLRAAELERRLSSMPGLHVLGNALHGVGLPDLIRDSRALARQLVP